MRIFDVNVITNYVDSKCPASFIEVVKNMNQHEKELLETLLLCAYNFGYESK